MADRPPMSPESPEPGDDASGAAGLGRFRRVMGAVGASVGLSLVFVTSLVASVVLHLNTAPTRRIARSIVNQLVFPDLFQGKVVVGQIDRLSLSGVTIRSVDAYDPAGAPVVHADVLRADANVVGILRSVLGKGDIVIAVPFVELGNADVTLTKSAEGPPTIAQVFLPRKPAGPPPPPSGRKARVSLDQIRIGHVSAHGDLVPGLDAEVSGALGRVNVAPEGLAIDVDPAHLDVRSPLPRPLAGNATFRLRGTGGGDPVQMTAGFDGTIGGLDVHTTAQLAGAHVAGRVEVPHATADAIASLVPGPPPKIPLRVPVSAVIEAEGNLPELVFRTKLAFEGGGSASADGTLALRSPMTVDVGIGLQEVDPRVLLDVPSATPLSADAHVWIEAGPKPKIDASATTKAFTIAGNTIPAVKAQATLSHGKWLGAVDVGEDGAPLHGTFSVDPATKEVDFEAETKVASIRKLGRVKVPVEGAADVKVKGALKNGVLDARVNARLGSIRAPGAVALDSGGVEARVEGPPDALNVDATVWGSGLQSGFYSSDKVTAHARGPLLAPRIDATFDADSGESLSVSGAVDAKGKAVTDVKLRLKRRDGELAGSVARVAATPGGVKVDGIALQGAGIGNLRGGLVVQNQEITGKLHGENVDLQKLALLTKYPGHLAGLANLDVDLSSNRPGARKGHIAVELVNGEAALLKGISGVFSATFDGDRVRTDALVRVVCRAGEHDKPEERCDGAIAQLRVTGGDGKLPGPLLDPRTWRDASGRVEIAADEWNLRCIRRLVPAFIPVPEVRGKLTTRLTIERAPGARVPTVKSFFARTLGLEVAANDWQSAHTDVEVTGSLDAATGEAEAKVSLLDGVPLGSAELATTLDLPTLLDHPEKRMAALMRAPLHGKVDIPRRPVTAFAGLPSFVTDRLPLLTGKFGETLAGDVEVAASLDGTLEAPKLDARVKTYGLAHVTIAEAAPKPGETKPILEPVLGTWGLPLDLDGTLRYEADKATLDATIAHDGHVVTRAGGALTLRAADLMAGRFRPAGSVHADFDAFPVGKVPFFADRDVAGTLSGKVAMDGIGDRPSVAVDLHMDGLKIGRDLAYDRASVSLAIDKPRKTESGDRSASRVAFELSGKDAGKLTAAVSHDVSWEGGLVPVLDQDHAVKAELGAEHFRIAAAQPFVAGVVSRIDGMLDGHAKVEWSMLGRKEARLDQVDLKLSRGILNLPQLGQELHDVTLALAGGDKGVLRINDVRAEGTRGLVTGSGTATFDGLLFRKAELAFNIKKEEALPVTLEGVPLGDASGTIKLLAVAKPHGKIELTVGLPSLHVDLAPALGRSVQGADDNPDIAILHAPRPADEPVPGNPSGQTMVIAFNPLNVSVKGKILGRVPVEGTIVGARDAPVRVELGGKKVRVSGTLLLPRFTIDVLHKQFLIEHGSVKLNADDVARSFVNATARWDSPDNTSIFVDFVGEATPMTADKLKDKLKCRAADLSQEKCFSALLVGPENQAQGNAATQQGQSLAAQLIASEFSTDIGGGFSTSIGTTDDGSFRPGLTYNVGKAVVEASTYGVSGSTTTTAAGGAAAAKGQHALVTIDWRFWRNWSLRGKVDIGNDQQTYGADVLWQYRY